LNFPLKLAWKHLAEMETDNPSSPAVADGVVYFCSGRRMYAVNAETGSLKWRYPAEESLTAVVKSSPLVGDELVYFGGGDGRLYAVKKEDGSPAWAFVTKGIMNSSPVLVDDVVYVGSSDDHLYALDARTGTSKWPGGFATRDDVSGSPAVADGLVFFVSNDMVLYAVSAANGKWKWTQRVGSSSRASSPVVAEGTVYLATSNVIQAFQSKSGRLRWSLTLPSDVTTVPAAANGAVYLACRNGKLYAFTNAGKLKWKEPADIGAPAYGSPVIAGDTVIVGANKGILVAADVETGQVKWRYTVMPSTLDYGKLKYVNIAAGPAVSNGVLYALADDGALHAFQYDVPDNTPPHVSTVVPSRDFLMHGAPPIEIAAVFSDPGSGVKMDSIALTLDGESVEYKLIAERGIVYYKTPVTQPSVPLQNGRHTVALSLTDWVGNKTQMEWSFTVDNLMRRRGPTAAAPGTTRPGTPGGTPVEGPMGAY
jgi:outer membrane protein assembly factor BamB